MSTEYLAYGFTIDGAELNGWLAKFKYEQQVKGVLERIAQTQTGKILFTAMKATGRDLTIRPYTTTEEYRTGGRDWACNAYAANTDPVKAGEKGKPFFADGEPMVTNPRPGTPGVLSGEGKGIDVPVRFSASSYMAGGVCQVIGDSVPGSPGSEPDEVLFHELVHAYAMMSGKYFARPTFGKLEDYGDVEEFFAILITNIYATDPNNPSKGRPLRADHVGYDKLDPAQATL
jgi:hypothetical protein